MGFLDFLSPPKAKEVSLEEAKRLVLEAAKKEEKELADYCSKKFAQIRHLVLNLSRNAEKMESANRESDKNERVLRAALSSQKNLARQVMGLSKKLVPPQSTGIAEVRKYSVESLNSVRTGLLPYWKNIVLAKIVIGDEVKRLGEDLEELAGVFEELHKKVFSEKLEALFSAKIGFERLEESGQKLAEIAGREVAQKKRVAAQKARVQETQKSHSDLRASKAAEKMKAVEQELEQLADEKKRLGEE
ncbi:MAG: hypothetical protein NUV67_05550, partial [archaeon]|nr:hypothetical protein [archaeon]